MDLPALIEQCPEFHLPNPAKWVLQGHSKAGERTGFWLAPINVVLDAGVVTNRTPNAIFLTHSHVDHSWNLPWIFGCRTPKIKGFEHLSGRPVIAPKSAWPMLQQLELACHNLSVGNMDDDGMGEKIFAEQGSLPYIVEAGSTMKEVPGLKDIEVELLKCYHPAETIAFGFNLCVNKLKPEYATLPGKEIGKLRQSGVDVNERRIEPQVVFFGDTNTDALELHDEWKKYPVLIIECTVYPQIKNKTVKSVYDIGHVHWDGIFPFIQANPKNFFILIHSSQAVKTKDLVDFEAKVKETTKVENFKIWSA